MKVKLVEESLIEYVQSKGAGNLNEGLADFFTQKLNYIKDLMKKALLKFSPQQQEKMKGEVKQFVGMSPQDIAKKIKSAATAVGKTNESSINESLAGDIFNYLGLGIFLTFFTSLVTLFADDKYHFFEKFTNGWEVRDVMTSALMYTFVGFIIWVFIKFMFHDDDDEPTSSQRAEWHSSAYIANQSRQRDRNNGF